MVGVLEIILSQTLHVEVPEWEGILCCVKQNIVPS